MTVTEQIEKGCTCIGIELGSTRIKAVLISTEHEPLASGVFEWENQLENGIWTYALDTVKTGLQSCFADLMQNVREKYGIPLRTAGAIGISAMMHGYLVFDEQGELLVPFRTWRNTITEQAADQLTEAFAFNIPQRWSIAHLYQAILNEEPHVGSIRFMTTLAGYVHLLLTGQKVLGIGDASGMFPIDPKTGTYDAEMCSKFQSLTRDTAFQQNLTDILPQIVPVGQCAGRLTPEGARLLDPSGSFAADIPFCPPEGDAQTGMAATNSVTPRTGNVSAGTSIFAMVVLEQALKSLHREIDIVVTPSGDPVAMVHANNGSSDLDAWIRMLGDFLGKAGKPLDKPALYEMIYDLAVSGCHDCGGITAYNYVAGEQITGLQGGMPLLMRSPDTPFTVENLLRSLVYSCFATLKLGMDILTETEQVRLDQLYAHGGLFKTPTATQPILSAALGVTVTIMQTAGEGGAWGIALLASYMRQAEKGESLSAFLNRCVFSGQQGQSVSPNHDIATGFRTYMTEYTRGLAAERAAAAAKYSWGGTSK